MSISENEHGGTLSEARKALLEKRLRSSQSGMEDEAERDCAPVISFGQERLWYLQQLAP